MTPILYEKDEIDFTSQGLGSLVEIYDVDVEEQRNGLLQLTASYPVSGVRYADISVGRIILAKPNQRDDVHAFRIVSTELDISGYAVTIEADSITYDLTHNLVKHLNVSGNGQAFMTVLKNAVVNPSIFAFYSDIATSSKTSLNYVNPMEAIMGTTGSFLQIWGGELKRENRRVAMFNRRGRDNVATFRLGKNISGLKYSVDISSLVTRIIPTKSVQNDDQTTTTLEGTPVDSQYINNYEQIYTLPLEFTDDAIKTVADLNAVAKGWFTQSANTGRDKPTVTIDIDVLSLQDSADYQDKFKNLESVSLTDTVTVYVPEYGVNVTAIVNELHYDPILDRVTKMTVGTAKQSFADSSRTQLSDLQDKIISVQNQADATAVSANGKNKNYYGSVEPSHPQEGDTWFWVNGDKSGIKVFVNGEWVEPVDSDTQEKIANAVTDAVTQAKAHTDEVKQGLSTDIDTAKSQAASLASEAASQAYAYTDEVKQGLSTDIDTAKSQAASQASTAEANAKSAATSQFAQSQNALSAAKTDLTNSIASEASARNAAVAAANSQAQTYANQAKADALNTIAKEVTDRQNAVSALDTKATNAVNQAKSDITDTINAISVGDRNYILDTGNPKTQTSNGTDNQDLFNLAVFYSPIKNWGIANGDYIISFDWTLKTELSSDMQATVFFNQSPWQAQNFTVKAGQLKGHIYIKLKLWSSILTTTKDVTSLTFRIMSQMASGNTITYSNLFMKSGTIATDWTPAPEDVLLDYTTKDNQIKTTISQYQTTNDEKVSKVQTDATTALGLVATKVSQTDYDTKTGDLTTKYTQVKQTTDSQATDIVDIKETASNQASKINSISSDVDGTKQSISDIETTQDSQSDKINQITTDVNGTKQSITDIQTKDGKQDTRMGNIETSVSGVKSDFVDYKTDANGRISTAQTTAKTAVDGLALKVSKTDYDQKTGDLSTKINDVKQTADSYAQTIADIKTADGKQDARMSEIENTASGLKSTVSDLQTTTGKQSGDISTLQQRADGFDATVTKISTSVNSLNQINNVINSEFSPDLAGWYVRGDTSHASVIDSGSYGYNTSGYVVIDSTGKTGSDFYFTSSPYPVNAGGVPFSETLRIRTNVSNATVGIGVVYYDVKKSIIGVYRTTVSATGDWSLFSYSGTLPSTAYYISFDIMIPSSTLARFVISQPMIVTSTTIGDYVAGSYNNNDALAKVKLTADNAALNLSKYQTDADGRISKAQAGVEANANAITQKVSQTDYDTKTGDLTTKVNTAQSTADSAVTTIGNYQTSNDKRVAAAESAISQNADAIALKVTKTDYDNNNSQLNTRFTKVETTADGASTTVSKLQQTVNSLGQTNLINNSEFSPDLQGWSMTGSGTYTVGDYDRSGAVLVLANTGGGIAILYSSPIPLNGQSSMTISYKLNYYIFSVGTNGSSYICLQYLDSSLNPIPNVFINAQNVAGSSGKGWNNYIVNNFTLTNMPDGAKYIRLVVDAREKGSKIGINKPMLTLGTSVGAYVAGAYNNNAALSQVKNTADSISNFVRDSSGNISSEFQTALSKTSIITGSTLASSIKTQTSSQIASALTDNNGKIISLINQDSSGVQIAGENITLDGNTTFTDLKRTVNDLGQVNLVVNSEIKPDLAGWSFRVQAAGAVADNSSQGYSGHGALTIDTTNPTTSSQDSYYSSQLMPISEKQVTISYRIRTNVVGSIVNVGLAKATSDGVIYGVDRSSITTTSDWQYIQRTISLDDKTSYIAFDIMIPKNVQARTVFSQQMINVGARAGAYVSGQYNNNAALAQVKITADSISNFVRDSSGNISSDFQTALSKTSIITGSTLATSIKTQTSSQITSALTDNNGKIISLINQDASGVQIAGKNIVLNGDTTVTGAFKVSQANIANGAIGTAQIGDAAITSAKIANLDVSKITGNVTNFIQSNWNGVYESTTITNDGMQIFTSDVITSFGPYGINLTQGGESVGGIGVSSYVGMPTNFQGIAFNLDGTGDYMTWGARESGVTTGTYTTKLAWFRSSYKPSGQNAGFNFSSDSPVTFWGSIYGRDNTEPLKIDSFGMNGISAGGIGHNNGNSAITFGGDGETYVISGGAYYKLAKLVKALQPLIGLGLWSVPKNIDSSGTVTKWTNITT